MCKRYKVRFFSLNMLFRVIACVCTASVFLSGQAVRVQASENVDANSSYMQIPKTVIEKLANVTDEENLWILLPSNLSNSNLDVADFSLFKLNTGPLTDNHEGESSSEPGTWIGAESEPTLVRQTRDGQTAAIFREGKKMNLFGNVLNKPKVSPLYLVNGTVCRFVNTQPICTTLSTTGLFRGQTPIQGNINGQNGFFQQQQQQQQLNNNQPQQRQVFPNSPTFNNQPNNLQPFRPAALLDDQSPDLDLSANNSSSSGVQQKPGRQQVLNVVQATRPLNYITNRRPLNLLNFGRPFRNQYQRRGKWIGDSQTNELKAID